MAYLKVADKYYDSINHYGNLRTPPWIRLYYSFLENDMEFESLSDQSKYHFWAIMLLASRYKNKILYNPKLIMRKINANSKINFEELIKKGFLIKINELGQDASKTLARCYQDASTMLAPDIDIDVEIDRDVNNNFKQTSKIIISSEMKNFSELMVKFEKNIKLPLAGGKIYIVTQEKIDHWLKLFPDVSVGQELKNMQAWLETNRKKTERGIESFIVRWLTKNQDGNFNKR